MEPKHRRPFQAPVCSDCGGEAHFWSPPVPRNLRLPCTGPWQGGSPVPGGLLALQPSCHTAQADLTFMTYINFPLLPRPGDKFSSSSSFFLPSPPQRRPRMIFSITQLKETRRKVVLWQSLLPHPLPLESLKQRI